MDNEIYFFASLGQKCSRGIIIVPQEVAKMKHLFKIQEKIVPELIRLVELRYTILRNIYYNQPVGRRSLANNIDESERQVRNELEFLRSRG